jgi:hypothetical protein
MTRRRWLVVGRHFRLWPLVAFALSACASAGSSQTTGSPAARKARVKNTIVCPRHPKDWPAPDANEGTWSAISFSTRARPYFLRIPSPGTGGDTVLDDFSDRTGMIRVQQYPARATLINGRFHAEVAGPPGLAPLLELDANARPGEIDRNAVLTERAPAPTNRPEAKDRMVLILDRNSRFFEKLRLLHGCATDALSGWEKGT